MFEVPISLEYRTQPIRFEDQKEQFCVYLKITFLSPSVNQIHLAYQNSLINYDYIASFVCLLSWIFLSISFYRRSKQIIIFIEAICQGTVLVTKQHGDQSRCILLKLDCADETVNEMNGCNGKLEHYILVSFYSSLQQWPMAESIKTEQSILATVCICKPFLLPNPCFLVSPV